MRFIKKHSLIFVLLLSGFIQVAAALEEGIFMGLDLGATRSQNTDVKTVSDLFVVPANAASILSTLPIDEDDDSFAGRLFVGYQFNHYFAMVLGLTQLQVLDASADNKNIAVSPHADVDAKLDATVVDLNLQATLPIGKKFYFYAKGGPGGASYRADLDVKDTSQTELFNKNKSKGEFMPTAGVGFAFMPSEYFAIGAFYTRYFGLSDLPTVDMVGLNFTLHFAAQRHYCGEILC